MVRLSKQKQEKLENIMNLVEELGVDRVLARLRQTKMMSKEVLDDMKEWETDYEKRVALLGFLVSPEGKRAFGALFELAKVHEEQIRLQEEQEKLRQEQLNQQHVQQQTSTDVKTSTNHLVSTSSASDKKVVESRSSGTSNMKNKLRAQLNKKRAQHVPSGAQQNSHHGGNGSKSKKSSPSSKKTDEKDDPLLEEAARTLEEAQRQVKEKKRIDAFRSQLAASEALDTGSNASGRRSAGSPRTTPTPRSETTKQTHENANHTPRSTGISTSESASKKSSSANDDKDVHKHNSTSEKQIPKQDPDAIPKALNDFTKHKEEGDKTKDLNEEDATGQIIDNEVDKEDETDVVGTSNIASPSSQTERLVDQPQVSDDVFHVDNERHSQEASIPTVAVQDSNNNKVVEEKQSVTEIKSQQKINSTLSGILLQLLTEEINSSGLGHNHIDEVIKEWRLLRRERDDQQLEFENKLKIIQQLREEAKSIDEDKAKMQKEKDRFVFREFELQQKFQDLSQKHKNLREDHESLKQGNYQVQQNTKKTNKLQQEMKKKIAKLESKIKSMDKVTIRRGTQTEDTLDKDVHEALRMAEESLAVAHNDLGAALSKLKSAQQEVDEYKKQVNIKGREINKRERKSKKDEDTIRFVSRERDAMEGKLRKITEQMEYYKGLLDLKGKGNTKRPPPEKKEIKVQRCASGRHVVVKSVASCNASQHHSNDADGDDNSRSQSRASRPGSVKQTNKSRKPSAANSKSNGSTTPTTTDNRPIQKNNSGNSEIATNETNGKVQNGTPTKASNSSASSSGKSQTSKVVTSQQFPQKSSANSQAVGDAKEQHIKQTSSSSGGVDVKATNEQQQSSNKNAKKSSQPQTDKTQKVSTKEVANTPQATKKK